MAFRDQMVRFFEELFETSISAVSPRHVVRESVSLRQSSLVVGHTKYDLSGFQHIWVVGFGKAASSMALGIEDILADKITGGVIITKYGHGADLKRIKQFEARHPVPDSSGVTATKELVDICRNAGENDLVICLISGGGSALLTFPEEGLGLEDKQLVTDLLLRRGATIGQLNIVRKSLSRVKGGKLAGIAMPATLISLIISDVIGDPIETIASGPTAHSSSTIEDAVKILKRKDVWNDLTDRTREWFNSRLSTKQSDNLSSIRLDKVRNVIVANNTRFLEAAEKFAVSRNYTTLLLSSYVQGEAREISRFFGAIAKEIRHNQRPIRLPACVIAGGETTVTVQGNGMGGRNMEMVLAILSDLQDEGDVAFMSAGSDGNDGPTDAAGAIGFSDSIARARSLGFDPADYLKNNDSYHFFEGLGDLLITGPTGTNVMDIQIIIIH